jgi:chromosome segregation ATPase
MSDNDKPVRDMTQHELRAAVRGLRLRLSDMTQERDTLNWDRAQLTNRAVHAEQELAEARRQVEALCSKLASEALLPSETSSGLLPVQAWREWAAQQAKEGGK